MNEESFFDPTQVAAESNLRRAHDALAATSYSVFRGSNDPGYGGTHVDKAKRMHQAVKSLLDKGLLDQRSASRLQRVLRDEPHRVNILMNIDEKQVPDKADRQKIRQAVLLRAAHFGTDEARAFNTKLVESGKGSIRVDTPKVDSSEASKDVSFLKSSKDSVAKGNAPKDLHPMYVGNPNEQDIDMLDNDRGLDLDVVVTGHKHLFALEDASDPDGAAREQWAAIADEDYEPRTGISAHGGDAASMDSQIEAIIDHTLELNDISELDLDKQRFEDAKIVLQDVNSLLPKSITLEERSQALAEAAAIFLQPTSKGNDGQPELGNLDRAIRHWPQRQITMLGVEYADDTKHLEDAGFLREVLRDSANARPIGREYIFSPPLRSLMDDVQTNKLDEHRHRARPTLDAVFGDQLDGPGKTDALRYTYKQKGFVGREALFRKTCLDKMQGDDAAELERIMRPLHDLTGKIVAANPPSFEAPDGGRQGPNDPKVGGSVSVDPRQGGVVSYDPKAPIVGGRDQPSVVDLQAGVGSHRAMLGNMLMGTFLQYYDRVLAEKVANDELTLEAAQGGTDKAVTKQAVQEAVKRTLRDCRGLQNASRDQAHGWMKMNKRDLMALRTADNIDAGRAKGRRHTAQQLRDLNARWKKDIAAPYDPMDEIDADGKPEHRLRGSIDDGVVDNGIIEVED